MPTRLLLDGPNIESLLRRVHDDYGQHARIVHAEKLRSGGIAGFFPKERYEVTVEVDDGYVPTSKTSSVKVTSTAVEDDQPLALLLAEAMNQVSGETQLSEPEPRISTTGSAFADVLGSITSGLGVDSSVVKKDQTPMPVKNRSAVATTYEATPETTIATVPALIEVEVEAKPATRSRQLIRSDVQVQPPRPPRGAGKVLAMVGEATVAFNIGLELAKRMRIAESRVLLASPDVQGSKLVASRRLSDVMVARKRSLKLLSEATSSVVAIDLPISAIWDDEAVDWAQDMVGAVGAVEVWVVVDATRKFADLSRWLSRFGRVDALVVHNASITDDLYPILDLGYPVAMLDDRPATSTVWRSMLRASGGHIS